MTTSKLTLVVGRGQTGFTDLSSFVKSISINGNSTQFYRTCSIEFIATENGRKPAFKLEEGANVAFTYEGKRLFTGFLFSQKIDQDGNLSVTAYDANVYLYKSTNTCIFTNKKASDIIRILATDAGVPYGQIADTGYVIPYLRLSNMTLADMALKALTLTRRQTGKRFFMGCDSNGKLTLTNPRTGPAFIIEDGKNLMGITYSRSIEDTKTQAKVIGGPKGKETVVLVKDDGKRAKYGVLQAFEEMDEKATPSQVKQRAQTILKEQSGMQEQLNVEALGVPEVDIGVMVAIRNQMAGIFNSYYVTSVKHDFENSLHTMSLELTSSYDLPNTTINTDEVKK